MFWKTFLPPHPDFISALDYSGGISKYVKNWVIVLLSSQTSFYLWRTLLDASFFGTEITGVKLF